MAAAALSFPLITANHSKYLGRFLKLPDSLWSGGCSKPGEETHLVKIVRYDPSCTGLPTSPRATPLAT